MLLISFDSFVYEFITSAKAERPVHILVSRISGFDLAASNTALPKTVMMVFTLRAASLKSSRSNVRKPVIFSPSNTGILNAA